MEDLSEYYKKVLGLTNLHLTAIDPNLILNDHQHYQRNRIEAKVQHRMKHFGKEEYNSGVIAQRIDGSYWSINGQHHADAAVRLGISSVNYYVFNSPGWEFEQTVFNKFQELQLDTPAIY